MMKIYVLALSALLVCSPTARAADPAKPFATLEELRAKYRDRNGKIAVIKGVEVYYKDEGRGPTILMVHGSQSTLKTWDHVVPSLLKRYRVIRFDIPPQGLSGRVTDADVARIQPTDIPEELLAQLGVTKITYVGVSSGGTLGFFLAAKRPDLVERLILSNTPADPVKTGHLQQPAEFLEAQRLARETGFQSRNYWNLFLDYFSGDPRRLDTGIREQYYDFNRRGPEKNYLGLVAVVANHEKAVAAMNGVRAPTLLIWGGKDALLVPASARALAGYLTGTQVSTVFMPDVGHYPPLESPQRFAQIVAAYIEAATP
jgi:pimeloyl-ACP methyl ester carboxylesterase